MQSLGRAGNDPFCQATSSKGNGGYRRCKASGERAEITSAKRQAPGEMAEIGGAKPPAAGTNPLCQTTNPERNGRDLRCKASGRRAEIAPATRQAPNEIADIGAAKPRVGGQESLLPSDKLRATWLRLALQSLRWVGRDRFFQPTNSCELAQIGAAKLRVGGPRSPLPNDKLRPK